MSKALEHYTEQARLAVTYEQITLAITRLERQDSTQEDRFAAADGLRAILSALPASEPLNANSAVTSALNVNEAPLLQQEGVETELMDIAGSLDYISWSLNTALLDEDIARLRAIAAVLAAAPQEQAQPAAIRSAGLTDEQVLVAADEFKELVPGSGIFSRWVFRSKADLMKFAGAIGATESVPAASTAAAVRREALEEAIHAAENTDVATCGRGHMLQDDGGQTRQDIVEAIRALQSTPATKEQAPVDKDVTKGGAA